MFSLFLTLNACLRYQTPTCLLVGQTMTSFHMHSFIPEDIYEKVVKKEKSNYLELISCGGLVRDSLLIQLS